MARTEVSELLGEIVPRKGDVNPPKRAGIHFTRAKYRDVNNPQNDAVILRPARTHACESNESSDTGRLGRSWIIHA